MNEENKSIVTQSQKNEEKIIDLCIFKAVMEENLTKDKLKLIKEYLDKGADIDAIDSKNNNNTLLHVSAITGNQHIFELLLSRGANYNIKNNDNHTVIDIIGLPDTPNGKKMALFFYKRYGYTKRAGTSGVKGELYETKLLSLILVRALHKTKEFILGTNVPEMGALDDIVLRYKTNNMLTPKIIFLQTKHRENERWSVEYILKLIHEYYESYIQIRQKLFTSDNSILFENSNENIKCEFVIYTSAKEYVTRNKNSIKTILTEENGAEDSLIKTSRNGKVFKVQYEKDLIDSLVTTCIESRIKSLAKTLAKIVLKDRFENIMIDDFIRPYHIFLAHNVIKKCQSKDRRFIHVLLSRVVNQIAMRFLPITLICVFVSALRIKNSTKSHENHIGQFRASFLTTNDEHLLFLKHELCKEIAKLKGIKLDHQQKEVENLMKSFTFKLPNGFGTTHSQCIENETQIHIYVNSLYTTFQKLFISYHYKDSKYVYVKLDDDSFANSTTIQKIDLTLCNIIGLVGNLLIHDNETEMFKFNMNAESLPKPKNILLQQLKEHYDLSVYRFDINIHGFPKLKLYNRKHDEELIRSYLDQLKIYTNQSQEDEVENILKDEIYDILKNGKHKQPDVHICNKMYLNIHDKIQKWRLCTKSPYLTKFHNFYQQAERETFNNYSQLKVLHSNCMKKFKNTSLHFDTEDILALRLYRLLDSDKKNMTIFTDEIFFTSIKINQFFTEISQEQDYIFINLDTENIEDRLEILHADLEYSEKPFCIIISLENTSIQSYYQTKSATETKQSKIIIITHQRFEAQLNTDVKIIYHVDRTNFSSLSNIGRKTILEERKLIFQGQEVNVNAVLNDSSLNLLSSNLLLKICNNEKIVLGQIITRNFYDKTVNYYVPRTLYRCIKLKKNNDLFLITEELTNDSIPKGTRDVVLLTKKENIFKNICLNNNESNIHWFTNVECKVTEVRFDHQEDQFVHNVNIYDVPIWKQSQGSLETISKYVERDTNRHYIFEASPKTLKDMNEKVVIINADSGMGKSTLLTHLAINTKLQHPTLWIIKINLLDDIILDQLSDWKEFKIKMDIIQVIKFLYTKISDTKNYNISEISNLISVNDKDEIYLNEYDTQYFTDIDLSEIRLFNYFYNNNNVALLVDGFDEICPDYAGEVIALLYTLKTSKVAHLWITSRPHNILEQLEYELGSFSYSVNPLTFREQRHYLQIVWHQKLGLELLMDSMKLIDKFYSLVINERIMDEDFLSLPLHLYMFAEIYQNDLKDLIDSKKTSFTGDGMDNIILPMNLTIIYEQFTNKKFDIQFGEKNSSMNSKDPTVRNTKEDKRKEFFENSMKLSAYLFLDKNIILPKKSDIKIVEDFITKVKSGVEKTGIIECRVDKQINFIHITFAEYFCAEFIFDKLRSADCTSKVWKYFIDVILSAYGFGIQSFINSKLQNDQSLITHLKKSTGHMDTVFKTLLAQFNHSRKTAIYFAIEHDFEYIFLFLIECLRFYLVLNKHRSEKFFQLVNRKCGMFCTFCFALTTCSQSVINCLKDLVTDIGYHVSHDFCVDTKLNQLGTVSMPNDHICIALNSLTQEKEVIDVIQIFMSNRNDNCIKYDSTYWFLGRHGYLTSFCFDHISMFSNDQRGLFFNFNDSEDFPIQYVCKENGNNFYNIINTILGKAEIEKICVTENHYNFKYIFIMLKNILKEVYYKSHQLVNLDVENIVCNELPKLRPNNSSKWHENWLPAEQIYKNKLFKLILLRVLCNDDVDNFLLTTQCTETLFDDVILRYNTNETRQTKMLFVKIMYNYTNVPEKEVFNIEKALQSYLFIKRKFSNKHEIICHGSMKDIDCKFIIYDTVKEKSLKNKLVKSFDDEQIMLTKPGQLFKLIYDEKDVDLLVPSIVKLRAIELAKTLAMYIISGTSCDGMVNDELIQTYHALLDQKVIMIESISHDHCRGKFRREFLETNEESIIHMKREICERLAYHKQILQNEAEELIHTYSFNLPVKFSHLCLELYGGETEQQEGFHRFCSIFDKLFQITPKDDSEQIIIISLDEHTDGLCETIRKPDLVGKDSLAGLVGTLLVNDNETELLKFNFSEENMSNSDRALLRQLIKNYDLKRYRFDINIEGFPKLTLNCKEYDRKCVRDFLSKLRFYYTNYTNIDKVERLLKNETYKYFTLLKKHNDATFRVKCDITFFTNLKYCIKYAGLYKRIIYNTYDLESYKVPISLNQS